MTKKENQHAFKTEADARTFARTKGNQQLRVIHSPHEKNTKGDYFVEWPEGQHGYYPGFVRNWERMLYQGKGNRCPTS